MSSWRWTAVTVVAIGTFLPNLAPAQSKWSVGPGYCDQARRLINGAAWAWRAYLGDYQKNPIVPTRLAAFASDHGLPQERFYNLVCLAFGANSQEFADFASFLPPTWSPNCSHEYQTLVRAFRQEIRPHIDQEQARVVLDTVLLEHVEAKPPPQK